MSREARVAVGSVAPDFALPDPVSESMVRLADFRDRHDVLLVFFRGTWCPFCRQQIQLLAENQPRLSAAGIATIGVACQAASSVRRYLQKAPSGFPVLADESRSVARAYGAHYWLSLEGAHLANPSLFVIDRSGSVTMAYRGRNMSDLPIADVLEKLLAPPTDAEPARS